MTITAAVTTGISLLPYSIPSKDGFIGYLLVQLVILFYTFSPNDYTNRKRAFITVALLFPGICMALELTAYRGNVIAALACVISIAAFLNVIMKEREVFKDEIGLMAVPFAHSVVRITLAIIGFTQ